MVLEILEDFYRFMIENRPVIYGGGHMSPLFPNVVVIREPGETVSINTTLDNIKEDTTK